MTCSSNCDHCAKTAAQHSSGLGAKNVGFFSHCISECLMVERGRMWACWKQTHTDGGSGQSWQQHFHGKWVNMQPSSTALFQDSGFVPCSDIETRDGGMLVPWVLRHLTNLIGQLLGTNSHTHIPSTLSLMAPFIVTNMRAIYWSPWTVNRRLHAAQEP